MQDQQSRERAIAGTAQVEEVMLVALVALGVAAANVPLGKLLLDFYDSIELVLLLPIP